VTEDSNFLYQHKTTEFNDPFAEVEGEEEFDFNEQPIHFHVSKPILRAVLGLAGIGGLTVFYIAVKLVNRF
jgi:hypothetical protein